MNMYTALRGNLTPVAAALALALLAMPALSQQPTAPSQPPPQTGQQPGQGAQVRTGTSSGLDADARIQNLLADHQYVRVEAELANLPPDQAQLYRGILANRSNDLKDSIQLLEPLLDQVAASGNIVHEKLLRQALAEDYLRHGDWAKATVAYQALDASLGAKLTPDEQDGIELPVKLLPLAKDNPPITVDPCDPFTLQVSQDPLGLIDIPVFVDADPKTWMLDPTAPFNLINRSTAKEVGLKISDETATIHTLTGRPIQVHMAVVPRFTIGGRLTLNNMTVFVYDDADYFFPHTQYQVEGVLGYPALQALGSITISDEATIKVIPAKEVDPAAKTDPLTTGSRFYLDGDQIIVGISRTSFGTAAAPGESADDRMYAVDAGGQQTYLTSRYFDEHASDFTSLKMELYTPPGYASSPPQPSYVAETVPLTIGNTSVKLHFIRVLTQPLGSAALDDVYGILGVDALDQLASYTFDYRTMRFSVTQQ
jgi:hypothetical protein